MSIFEDFGLRKVINANGKMTILGTSTASEKVSLAAKNALENFVVMDELIDYTGSVIARITEAEAGCPTNGAASGIAIAVAACIAGENIALIERMPDSSGLPNEIILQKGHGVNFGGSVVQMIRLGGGKAVEAGYANKVEYDHVENAVNENTAALLYVKSHHCVQKGMLSIEEFIEIGKKHNLPVIIDGAAEEDMKKYAAMGADMVIYSGGKALCGPTSGFICGKRKYINACKMQFKGIGRAMKVSKEAMAGLIAALESYDPLDTKAEMQKERMSFVCRELNKLSGLSCSIMQDEAGREIYRAEIRVNKDETGISAKEIEKKLKNGNPAIYLRSYNAAQGILHIDPRPLFDGEDKIIVEELKKILNQEER